MKGHQQPTGRAQSPLSSAFSIIILLDNFLGPRSLTMARRYLHARIAAFVLFLVFVCLFAFVCFGC